jgi:hypothetical protein
VVETASLTPQKPGRGRGWRRSAIRDHVWELPSCSGSVSHIVRTMKRLVPTLMLALGLLVVGCSSGRSSDIRDFSEIAVSTPIIEFDPSGTAATLRVSTNQDAVCAVAYGTDGPFGTLATDQDMDAGRGHSDHRPVMTGLLPGTEYQYRLQGVAEDGMIYRSEVRTFTTPTADSAEGFGINVAIDATVIEVSSEFSAVFGAANAVDADLATEWSSRGDGDDAFITIDLGRPVDVTAVAFRTRSMSDGSAVTETFTVEVGGAVYGPFPAGASPSEVTLTGRVLTYRVESSTGGNTGAVEIEAYAKD